MSDKRIMETVVQLAGSIDPSLAKSIQEANVKIGKLNIKAIAMGAAFAGAVAVATKALYNLGAEFDNAYDAIRIGTGATGEALEALKDDFKDVYGSVPTTMEDASKAISDYNTRLGLTGKELSELSKQAIAVSGLLEEDLGTTIETSSQAFQQWAIDAKDMGKQMDYIFKVSQSTGISFNELMLNMQQYGPQLQDMGYSFEEASAMIGQMEKAGVNTTEVLAAMKKAVGTLAKEGISASAGMQIYYEKIKNAQTAAEAAALANEVFGARAGSTMASAIRNGTMEIEAFTKALNDSNESIMGAMWNTADAAEKFGMLQQKFNLLIEPLASGIFDNVAELMPTISRLFERLSPVIEELVTELLPLINALFTAFADVIEVLAPIISLLAKIIGSVLTGALHTVMPIFNNLMGILTNIIDFVVNVFTLKWGSAWKNIVNVVKNIFTGLFNTLVAPFRLIFESIGTLSTKFGNKNTTPIPALAAGGFTNGLSFAGEKAMEAVISFDPTYRAKNINTWLKAGELLGISSSSGNSYNLGGLVFSPKLYITESISADDVISKLKSAEGDFCDMIDEWLSRKAAVSYASSSFAY